MEAVDYKVDKSGWERGPWDGEPDLEHLTTADGLSAVIVRTSWSGNFCGYVGVPTSHPWHGKEYSATVKPTAEQSSAPVDMDRVSILSLLSMAASDTDPNTEARIDCVIRVHGGLTYAGAGREKFGEDPSLWYFGFDCAHSGDLSPAYDSFSGHSSYSDIDYVRDEIVALSKQLAEVTA